MSNASDCYQWWKKLFIEVGGPSAWCEGNHFKVGSPGPGNENFFTELSQSLVFLHICMSEVDGPEPSRPPGSSIYDCYPVAKSTALQPTHDDSDSSSYDIGTIEWSKLSDMEKVRFLTEPWFPPKRFEWPYTERKDRDNTRRKYLGPQHFTGNFDVFSYLLSKGGIYCRPCAIFAPDEVRGVKLNKTAKTPLQKYTHLTGKNGYLTEHLSKEFYEDSLSRSNAFVSLVESKAGDIEQQAKVGAAKQREKNRRALERIILSIEFLGRLGFLCADTVTPVLCLCLKRVRRTWLHAGKFSSNVAIHGSV